MARLPIEGSDIGTWGAVLNEYLEVAHNPDGTAKSGGSTGAEHNVVDYGATLDGSTDDSGAIQDAIDAAADAGGGVVLIPGRGDSHKVIINSPLELKTGVWLRGLGSCTSLAGTADPMIMIHQVSGQDRMTISDLFLQDPDGVGVQLGITGGYQLGWPRITVENVTVTDAAGRSFWVQATVVIECRFINCVSMRAGDVGFMNEGTDNFFIGCTAAEGASSGFHMTGGNSKLSCCKAYGNDGDGYVIAGSGRHMLAGCESQDNGRYGFSLEGQHNTLAGCLADTDRLAGVNCNNHWNSINGAFMYGGGGTGQITKAGVFFQVGTVGNVVSGRSNCAAPVSGDVASNFVQINAATGSRTTVAYATPWTPNPYDAETQAMTLTGNLTLVNPVYKHIGQRFTLELRQDGTGGRTVTLPDQFRTNWTPSTTANHLNVITFEYDGTAWQQLSSAVGLTAKPSIGVGDTFNRANEVLGTSSSGHTWTKFNQAGGVWNVVSNQAKTIGSGGFQTNIAVLEAGVPDFTAQVTVAAASGGAGLILRYSDSSNYLKAADIISKVVAGVETVLVTGLNPGAGDVVKVVASGPTFHVYKNGTLWTVVTDAFNLSATKAGIYAASDSDILDGFTLV